MIFAHSIYILGILSNVVHCLPNRRSPTREYVACERVDQGGNGFVVSAVSYAIGSTPVDCTSGDRVILKCAKKENAFDDYKAEYLRMEIFASKSWAPGVIELFRSHDSSSPSGVPCIAMEHLGPDLSRVRHHFGNDPWSWGTIGSIGARMIDIIESLHKDFEVCHTDLHAANWMLGYEQEGYSPNLRLADFGDTRPIRVGDDIEDVKQIVLMLRYLRDGDRKYYVWKRYHFDRTEVCAGVPTPLCEAMIYIKDLPPTAPLDYQRVRGYMVRLAKAGGVTYKGQIEWGPVTGPAKSERAAVPRRPAPTKTGSNDPTPKPTGSSWKTVLGLGVMVLLVPLLKHVFSNTMQ